MRRSVHCGWFKIDERDVDSEDAIEGAVAEGRETGSWIGL